MGRWWCRPWGEGGAPPLTRLRGRAIRAHGCRPTWYVRVRRLLVQPLGQPHPGVDGTANGSGPASTSASGTHLHTTAKSFARRVATPEALMAHQCAPRSTRSLCAGPACFNLWLRRCLAVQWGIGRAICGIGSTRLARRCARLHRGNWRTQTIVSCALTAVPAPCVAAGLREIATHLHQGRALGPGIAADPCDASATRPAAADGLRPVIALST